MRLFLSMLSAFFLVLFGIIGWASYELKSDRIVFYPTPNALSWSFQAIDTMKYSRDLAREKLLDPAFETTIERQVKNIADTGATHVSIATPYDEEFFPFLEKWVRSARANGLRIWFRGNWSGWEGWFDYPRIGREEHLQKTRDFILNHQNLFEDGDVFSSCPECENGGPGDPRMTGDVDEYRRFIVEEYRMMKDVFGEIHKSVRSNFFSMNGDVARLVMDQATTRQLDGIVTIDHYVKTPLQLAQDVESLAQSSGGRIILGEFGAPIPDIHGRMTQAEQSRWIDDVLRRMEASDVVEGLNYWLAVGGSTALWSNDNQALQGAETLALYFKSVAVYGFIYDELGRPIANAHVKCADHEVITDENGYYIIRYLSKRTSFISVDADGFDIRIESAPDHLQKLDFTLIRSHKDFKFKTLSFIKNIMQRYPY